MSIRISVIVPVFNLEKYIGRCLDSLIAQTYTDIEILVIDDGSQDNSFQIVREYERKYGNIKSITQTQKMRVLIGKILCGARYINHYTIREINNWGRSTEKPFMNGCKTYHDTFAKLWQYHISTGARGKNCTNWTILRWNGWSRP